LKGKTATILDTKNKDNLELPLSDYVLEILQRRNKKDKYVFLIVEVKKFLAWVRDDSGVEFTIHDLRRSFITYAEALDIGLLTIKAMVNQSIPVASLCFIERAPQRDCAISYPSAIRVSSSIIID
jgi:integrase